MITAAPNVTKLIGFRSAGTTLFKTIAVGIVRHVKHVETGENGIAINAIDALMAFLFPAKTALSKFKLEDHGNSSYITK